MTVTFDLAPMTLTFDIPPEALAAGASVKFVPVSPDVAGHDQARAVVLWQDPDPEEPEELRDWWIASCESLGATSQGANEAEAIANIREAMTGVIEVKLERGHPVAAPDWIAA